MTSRSLRSPFLCHAVFPASYWLFNASSKRWNSHDNLLPLKASSRRFQKGGDQIALNPDYKLGTPTRSITPPQIFILKIKWWECRWKHGAREFQGTFQGFSFKWCLNGIINSWNLARVYLPCVAEFRTSCVRRTDVYCLLMCTARAGHAQCLLSAFTGHQKTLGVGLIFRERAR